MNNSRTQPLSVLKIFLLYFKETELRKGARVGVVVVHSRSIAQYFSSLELRKRATRVGRGEGGLALCRREQ